MSLYRRSRSKSPPSNGVEPCLRGYQLIGDSQFLRFSEQLLDKRRKQVNGISFLGLCVSGQKIGDLLKRVKDNFAPVSKKAVLMIGTNDLLRGTTPENMREHLDSLLHQLRRKGADKIILLTIPPVPKLAANGDHWIRLSKYNEHILRKHDGRSTIVVNAYAKFVLPKVRKSIERRSTEAPCPEKRTPSILRLSAASGPSSSILANSVGPDSPIPNLKCNIRVSLDEERRSRQVYLLSSDSDDESSPTKLPRSLKRRRAYSSSGDEDGGAGDRSPCRDDFSSSLAVAVAKRRRLSSGSYSNSNSNSIANDDHGDLLDTSTGSSSTSNNNSNNSNHHHQNRSKAESWMVECDEALKNADRILDDYFEKFFSGGRNRTDLIHFNNKGLCVIQRLIIAAISD